MKFQIGERYRVNYPSLAEDGAIIEVISQDSITNYYRTVTGAIATCNSFENTSIFAEHLIPVLSPKIIITSDATTTTARLYDGDKVIKSATAKYNPGDQAAGMPYSFETGARLAFDRLLEKTDKKSDASPKYRVGDKVRVIGHSYWSDFPNGEIVELIVYCGSDLTWRAKSIKDHNHTQWVQDQDIEPYAEPSKKYNIGARVLVCGTKDGCKGAENKEGTITTLPSTDGLPQFKPGINVKFNNGHVWRVNEDAINTPRTLPFDWSAFKSGKIAVHCDTEDKAKAFLRECEDHGYKDRPTMWGIYKAETCYQGLNFDNTGYSGVSWYKSHGFSIIDYPYTAPAVTSEPIAMLYCTEDFTGCYDAPALVKGNQYSTDAVGHFVYDGGDKTVDIFSNAAEIMRTWLGGCLVPMVKRNAKEGEWILVVKAENTFNDYKNGDVFKASNIKFNGAVYEYGVHKGVHISPSEYVVLDGYQPKPEPEKLYNGRVVFVENKAEDLGLTVGKIYEFKDGYSEWDDGEKMPNHKNGTISVFHSFSELEKWFGPEYKFLEIVEANS